MSAMVLGAGLAIFPEVRSCSRDCGPLQAMDALSTLRKVRRLKPLWAVWTVESGLVPTASKY